MAACDVSCGLATGGLCYVEVSSFYNSVVLSFYHE